MIAQQYTARLPADYDMRVIRDRVATRGPAFDDMPGLLLKAFLIRERRPTHRDGPTADDLFNEYAPFYVWRDVDRLWDFAAGAGFRGIVDSFGWLPIRTWLPIDAATHTAIDLPSVRSAIRSERSIAPGTDLAALRVDERDANRAAFDRDDDVVARVVAIDPSRWSLVRFTLSSQPPAALEDRVEGDRFEVLRVAAPTLRARTPLAA